MSESVKEQFKMIEIYGGKDDKWKGFYNLCISDGNTANDIPIAGPIHPVLAERILSAINCSGSNDGMRSKEEVKSEIKKYHKKFSDCQHSGSQVGEMVFSKVIKQLKWVLNEQEGEK